MLYKINLFLHFMSTSCVIYAKSPYIPYDIWTQAKVLSHTSDSMSEFTLNQLIDSISVDSKTILKTGHGLFIKMNSVIYILTCYHIIENAKVIYGYLDVDSELMRLEFSLVGKIKEFDIAVLSPSIELLENVKYIDVDIIDINCDLSYVKSNQADAKIKYIDQSITKKINVSYINSKSVEIADSYLKSTLLPKIPLIKFTCDIPDSSDEFDPDGLSGACVTINDNIVGMIFNHSEKALDAIPIHVLKLLAKAIISNRDAIILSGCAATFHTADIIVHNVSHVVKLITDDNQIVYKTTFKNNYKFKKDTIITQFNYKSINNLGKLHIDGLNYAVNVDAYIMFSGLVNEYVTFKILKASPDLQKIRYKEIALKPRPFEDQYVITINNPHKYVHYDGITFCELSEELLITLIQFGIKLDLSMFSKYKDHPISDKKIVIIIDINFKKLSGDTLNILTKIGAPYVKTFDEYTLLAIEKINKKKISGLNELIESFKTVKKRVLSLNTLNGVTSCKIEI